MKITVLMCKSLVDRDEEPWIEGAFQDPAAAHHAWATKSEADPTLYLWTEECDLEIR